MSNKFEIQHDLVEAQNKLNRLCQAESKANAAQSGTQTITIEPQFGDEMQRLREECSQLSIILEAIEASED